MRFFSFCLQSFELVAGAANGHEPLGPGGVVLDLATDVRDVQVTRPLVSDESAVPEMTHDLPPREDAPRLACEQCQQLELEDGQRDASAAARRPALAHVDAEDADPPLLVAAGAVQPPPAAPR